MTTLAGLKASIETETLIKAGTENCRKLYAKQIDGFDARNYKKWDKEVQKSEARLRSLQLKLADLTEQLNGNAAAD